jgi:hypothetical protein
MPDPNPPTPPQELPKDIKEKLREIIQDMEKKEAGQKIDGGTIDIKIDTEKALWFIAYST